MSYTIPLFLSASLLALSKFAQAPICFPYNNDSTDERYRYSENGIFYPDRTINVRTNPTTKANAVATYSKGEYVNYDTVVIGERYNWISYISAGGARRYMAIRDKKGDNKMWGRAEQSLKIEILRLSIY